MFIEGSVITAVGRLLSAEPPRRPDQTTVHAARRSEVDHWTTRHTGAMLRTCGRQTLRQEAPRWLQCARVMYTTLSIDVYHIVLGVLSAIRCGLASLDVEAR